MQGCHLPFPPARRRRGAGRHLYDAFQGGAHGISLARLDRPRGHGNAGQNPIGARF